MGSTARINGRSLFRVFVLAFALLLVSAPAALAQYPPDVEFGVSSTPENPQPGDTVTNSVVGASAGETITWRASVGNRTFASGEVTADAEGRASFTFVVPTDAGAEKVTVSLFGSVSGAAESEIALVSDETPVDDGEEIAADADAAADTGALADTGIATSTYVLTALALIALGSVAVFATRRRESSRVSA